MKTALFYYSGTGNSLWIARNLSEIIQTETSVLAMKLYDGSPLTANAIGLVFPVHMWGLPHAVIDFVNKLPLDTSKYYFALAVNAGQVSNTLIQAKKTMKKRGLTLDAGFDIIMPSNYIPWGGPGTEELQRCRYDAAKKRLVDIAYTVEKKYPTEIERGPLWQRIFLTLVYKLSFKHIAEMDSAFWADDKCNQCGICKKICPAQNISINGKPSWHHKCEQCFACLQWCPQESIQYGKKSIKNQRYHNPEISINDMINSVPENK